MEAPIQPISEVKPWFPWVVWGLAAAFFFFDYIARVSTSVMADNLMTDFQLSAYVLGSLSAFFYWPYVAMQIPVGLIVDRHSIRSILTIMAFMAGLSCFLFARAQQLYSAEIARFLLGFSASFAFVSAIKLAAEWFPRSRLGLLAGLTQALGMLGAYFGEGPMAVVVNGIGWRSALLVMTIIFIILGFAIGIWVRDRPPGAHDRHIMRQELGRVHHNLWQILKTPQSLLVALYTGLLFAPTGSFGELWGVNYLMHAEGLSHLAAAQANGMIFIGWAIGGPLMGWCSDRSGKGKPFMIASAVVGMCLLSILIFVPQLSRTAIFLTLFLYGMSNYGVSVGYAIAVKIQSKSLAGVSLAFTNMMSVIVAAFMQPALGQLMDYFAGGRMVNNLPVYTAGDYHKTMFVLPAFLFLAMLVTFFIREPESH